MSKTDPHRSWLIELRATSTRLAGAVDDDQPGTVPRLKQLTSSLQGVGSRYVQKVVASG